MEGEEEAVGREEVAKVEFEADELERATVGEREEERKVGEEEAVVGEEGVFST